MINIAVSSRSVHAAVEAAIAEHMREQRRRSIERAEELDGRDA
jgi:hypothetical protein